MVDLTKNKKERNDYIIDIDEYPYLYLVKYASGKGKAFPKTEAIREELLKKLEKQFWNFSQEYKVYAKYEKKLLYFRVFFFMAYLKCVCYHLSVMFLLLS